MFDLVFKDISAQVICHAFSLLFFNIFFSLFYVYYYLYVIFTMYTSDP